MTRAWTTIDSAYSTFVQTVDLDIDDNNGTWWACDDQHGESSSSCSMESELLFDTSNGYPRRLEAAIESTSGRCLSVVAMMVEYNSNVKHTTVQ